jgi:hypothetical protein
VATASCAFAVTSITPTSVWQNGGEWVQLQGAGFVSGMSVFIGDARAPVRVVDAKSAIVQVPPGPIGPADVKIATGSSVAVTHGGLDYVAAGLLTPWQQRGLSHVRGEWPAVAVLQDGRVLIAGGTTVPDDYTSTLATAEIFARKSDGTDSVSAAANSMSSARWRSTAVTLLSGKVLVLGGACSADDAPSPCVGDATTADLFDPTTNTFAPTKGKLKQPRINPRAALLVDGRVLIASATDPSLEIFDPDAETFTLLPHTVLHNAGFMVRLRSGDVLLGGGSNAAADVELLSADDPSKITSLGPLHAERWWSTVHVLPDGRTLLIGGGIGDYTGWTPEDSIESFDPTTKTFTLLPFKLSTGRGCHASALVRDGTILVMGGYDGTPGAPVSCSVYSDTVDQINPVKGTVTTFAKLPNRNTEWNAVTMLDGSVLGVGGGACGSGTALPDLDFLPGEPKPK